jgi:hypothetical protein
MISDLTFNQIEKIINNNLIIKEYEKKKWGQVFTPIIVINKILDNLPNEVYKNPYLKWLDPCAGIGNFMIIIYYRLMKGLENFILDSQKRSNYIIENMLFMIELNKDNVEIGKSIFGKKCNFYYKDFLLFNNENNKEFDIIIGNPPFQLINGKGGKNKLYEKMVNKSLQLLKSGGFLSMLVPDNLFGGNFSITYLELIKYNIKYINFSNFWTKSFEKIQQPICCFLLEKIPNNDNICFIFNDYLQLNKIELSLINRPVNPIRKWTFETEYLINKYLQINKNNSVYNRGKNIEFYSNTYSSNSYPIIYSPNKKLYTLDKQLAVGYLIKKIIIFIINTKNEFYIDWNGEYGVGPNTIYIPFDNLNQGKKFDLFFNSEIYKELMFSCKICRQFIKVGVIQYLNLDVI